jgi:hypothetical protein
VRLLALLLALAVALEAGPAAAQEPACPFPGQSAQLVVQMFFGQSMRGSLISRRAWERFVADTITPALPDGFTVYSGSGQWQDTATQMIGREQTEILLVAAPDSPSFRSAIAAIAEAYRRRFDQHMVGIITTPGCAAF